MTQLICDPLAPSVMMEVSMESFTHQANFQNLNYYLCQQSPPQTKAISCSIAATYS